MCGLVAVISKTQNGFLKEQQDVFSTLLFVDMLRGQDSTGVFTINTNGDAYVAKDALNSVDFMGTNEYEEAMKRAWRDGMALVGHNRKATRGNINDENAHPFNVDDNIILVHNGTMYGDHKQHADVEVDSHAIAHLIHEKGSVEEALSAFSGAYALIWYDVKEQTLNLIRNDQRPLWWIETPNAWIWSSEKAMLEFAIARHNLKPIEAPKELEPHIHQTFKMENRRWKADGNKLDIKQSYVSSGYVACGYNPAWEFGGGNNHHSFRNETEDYEEALRQMYSDGAHTRQRPYDPETDSRTRSGKVVELLPNTPKNTKNIIQEPYEFPGVSESERGMAQRENKIIPYGEYQKQIIGKSRFAYDHKVEVVPFDYDYVNRRDNSDGYYLYASPVDYDSIIMRQFFARENATEERMVQIASCGYVYEFVCGVRQWRSLNGRIDSTFNKNVRDDEAGFIVIRSNGCRMIARGLDVGKTVH